MENKRYFWLKFQHDFFRKREIKKLRKIAGGDTYTIIYLKLMLSSLKDDGVITFYGTEKTLAEQLSLELDEDIENIAITLNFMQSHGMIIASNEQKNTNIDADFDAPVMRIDADLMRIDPSIDADFDAVFSSENEHGKKLSTASYFLPDVEENIGKSTSNARRQAHFRERKALLLLQKSNEPCNIRNGEIEIEVEKEKDIEIIYKKTKAKKENNNFEKFWEEYPKKIAKKKALDIFCRINPHHDLLDKIIFSIKQQKKQEQDLIKHGKFAASFPYATAWLNQERWNDEVMTISQISRNANKNPKKSALERVVNNIADQNNKNQQDEFIQITGENNDG
ncbi:MAG: phage replisome organizer N-terminal domain-containing protein [Bacteroidetes bacterium]|nr:phage replisome organizer N-terminal domain-containing protein [Bacteroidota bacterium]